MHACLLKPAPASAENATGAGAREGSTRARASGYHGVDQVAPIPALTPTRRKQMDESPVNVTQLLRAVSAGDRRSVDALMAAIYGDLKRLAINHMQGERRDHTLQPTALVHEAYLKLIGQRTTDWKDRVHFFSVASRIIRRILVDHARERGAAKRGGGRGRSDLDLTQIALSGPGIDVIALDEALTELAAIDLRQAEIVEMRFFGGLTVEEVAELLAISPRSVDRDWRCAKAWLFCRLSEDGQEAAGE